MLSYESDHAFTVLKQKKEDQIIGRFMTDQKYEVDLKPHFKHPWKVVAAKAHFSKSTGSRLEQNPHTPSLKNENGAMAVTNQSPDQSMRRGNRPRA